METEKGGKGGKGESVRRGQGEAGAGKTSFQILDPVISLVCCPSS